MSIEGINSSQIDSMVAMLHNTAARAAAPSANPLFNSVNSVAPVSSGGASGTNGSVGAVSFADLLKNSVDKVNKIQSDAEQMGDRFAAGDVSTSLSDVMLETQKANVSFQVAVQQRNKLVAAYNEIMNMQI